ncbi:MAG: NAD(P)-dependent alcohol dehydrogenase [Gammaproteobacteria bacterium]|nr:NAD(P)-dependent alcohol dehydrogenase [Gammaproteobacteria bacterium]MDH5650563.1 NAD(P)-dependent alcohol dehydrogenase [Gammaproteobacteria bacterium]
MKAAVYTQYGPAGKVLTVREVERPQAAADQVLVRVHAATVNRTDCATLLAIPFFMRLVTGLLRPKRTIPGTSFAGEIIAAGSAIHSFKTGDRVFGFDDNGVSGQAEYLAIAEDRIALIPDHIDYAAAAAGPEGFHYALNFINKVKLKRGDRVMVYGASGAIGSAAVQLLKHLGIEVTAVCSTRHIAAVKSLGPDRVLDYTQKEFTNDTVNYHFIFDAVGKISFFQCKRRLLPGGAYGSSDLGYLAQNIFLPMLAPLLKRTFEKKYTIFPMPVDIPHSLALLRDLMAKNEFKPLIDREYPLDEIAAAYQYVAQGKKTGNVVVRVL